MGVFMFVFGLKVTQVGLWVLLETEGYRVSSSRENRPFDTLGYLLVSQPERVNENYAISYVGWRSRRNAGVSRIQITTKGCARTTTAVQYIAAEASQVAHQRRQLISPLLA